MKVYLDNNIVSAIAKDDEPAESYALDQLFTAWRKAKVDLVTSELTLAEIKRYQDRRMRAAIERIFRLLEKVEIVRWDKLVGMHSYGDQRTWISVPLIENDADYSALLALGLETVDAQHVFVAAKNGCDAFLTCDGGGSSPRSCHQKAIWLGRAETFRFRCRPRLVEIAERGHCGIDVAGENLKACPPPAVTAAIRGRPADVARSNYSPPNCKFGAQL